jgi:hypothetical protein
VVSVIASFHREVRLTRAYPIADGPFGNMAIAAGPRGGSNAPAAGPRGGSYTPLAPIIPARTKPLPLTAGLPKPPRNALDGPDALPVSKASLYSASTSAAALSGSAVICIHPRDADFSSSTRFFSSCSFSISFLDFLVIPWENVRVLRSLNARAG